jgi:hypothetical protein
MEFGNGSVKIAPDTNIGNMWIMWTNSVGARQNCLESSPAEGKKSTWPEE